MQIHRRRFLDLGTAVLAAGAIGTGRVAAEPKGNRKMTIDLCCGRIGVRADQVQAIAYAAQFGFESVEPNVGFLAQASQTELDEVLGRLKAQRLVWSAAGLPVDFRGEEEKFRDGLKALHQAAPALAKARVTRVGTWISPAHDELTYLANFRQHRNRLREVAEVLGQSGLRFGLEYVGPKTSWSARRYPFIHTMAETKELIAEIGLENVGLVLDSWHWYTAGETKADLETLTNKDVVAIDLNDAPAGLEVDQQIDSRRELPAATGVIDVGTFLNTLNALGCDAPVRAEPFNATLRKMPAEEALAATAAAMKRAFALIE